MPAKLKSTSKEALNAFKRLATNPVAALPETYATLGDAKALSSGIAFGVVSAVCFLLGGYMLLPVREGLFDFLGFGGVMKSILFSVMPFACTAAGSIAIRRVTAGAGGGFGGDCLIAGAAVLPMSLLLPISGLLGTGNLEVVVPLGVLAGCLGVLMLFSGYSRISKLSERASTFAVPIVVLLAAWLTKVLSTSIMTGGGPNYGAGNFGGF
ncbi:MAG: hypothetical protein L0Z55_03600 [Planctomycetes bacterium]|nr:hypothetical protein [Planctomycetota bacterium]